jgi:fructokinase
MSDARPLLGGIELGGTKCVCLVGTGPTDIRAHESLPTGADSQATLALIEATLRRALARHGPIAALGIASFGPVDLSRDSPTYGSITATPKPGWKHTPVVSRFAPLFDVPIAFDTDVNGAALAEGRWGAAQGLTDFAYLTVGTGIGGGLVVGGRLVHGLLHPELGHVRVPRLAGDTFPGACSFHGDCVEGLASGPAIAARVGMAADRIPVDHPVWDSVAHALGHLLHNLMLATSPRRILIGGGVIESRPELFEPIRRRLAASINDYLSCAELGGGLGNYVTAPGLGALAGPLGALALAAAVLPSAR